MELSYLVAASSENEKFHSPANVYRVFVESIAAAYNEKVDTKSRIDISVEDFMDAPPASGRSRPIEEWARSC